MTNDRPRCKDLNGLLTYRCDPLGAYILPAQCGRNRKLARNLGKRMHSEDKQVAAETRQVCLSCPGVEEISR